MFAVAALPVLARIPLLPAAPEDGKQSGDLLEECLFLASRAAYAAADGEHRRVTERGYDLRARWRPTPFGVFAGVTWAFLDPTGRTELALRRQHQARSLPSGAWLSEIASIVVSDPSVLDGLTLFGTGLAVRRGDRLEAEVSARPGGIIQRSTIRATSVTNTILSLSARGVSFRDLHNELCTRWPTAPPERFATVIETMIRTGFLVTDLLPARPSDDPLRHLSDRIPQEHELREPLLRLRSLLTQADRLPPGRPARLAALMSAQRTADALTMQESPLSVDTTADATIILPTVLGAEAAAAAAALWTVGRDLDPLAQFHRRFLERYGRHRDVPLLELLDPATGLGFDSNPKEDKDQPSTRRAALAALYHQAVAAGALEVQLTESDLDALRGPSEEGPPRTCEIYVQVIADSRDDLAAGQLRLAVGPSSGTRAAGSSLGRLLPALPKMTTPRTDEDSDALVAELLVAPRATPALFLAPPTGLAPAAIAVGVPVNHDHLTLDDLVVGSNGHHIIIWSLSRNQRVIPVLFSKIAPALLTPVAYFLHLAGLAGTRTWKGWSWEHLADMPFQPRVRYGRTILAPARWALPPAVRKASTDRTTWDRHLDHWVQTATPPPPSVIVTDDLDRRLPLDLSRGDDRELLRRYVRAGLTTVAETPGGAGAVQEVVTGPHGRHVLELVIPLTNSTRSLRTQPRPSVIKTPCRVRMPGHGRYLPGTDWLSLSIPGPEHYLDDLLISLAAIIGKHHTDPWFWLRYSSPQHGPHLRARFHGKPADLSGRLLPVLADWADTTAGLATGFTIETYEQEIERYGGDDASISAAEHVFATDSAFAVYALSKSSHPNERLGLAALSAATIASLVADDGLAALSRPRLDRTERQRAATLRPRTRALYGSMRNGSKAVSLLEHPTWTARTDALLAYRDTLNPDRRTDCASSMIHMHCNRLLSSTTLEPISRALAVDLLHWRP
ncbi:lantibiotic dehydratase [Actinocorallia longicatena]|uniref:Lantibiotic dehydratase n=1 Tax=Actinocorallia longicatena TaxID=111803 RepID=A0ABP6QLC1_9ACTN